MWEVASCNCGDIGDVNFVTQYISCFLTLQSTFDYKKLRESCSGCRTRKSCKLSISTDIACLPSITLVLRCSAAAGKNNDSCRDAYVEWKCDELSGSQAICACGWLSWFICVARVQFVDAPFRIFISNPDDVSPLSNLPRVKWENASKSLSIGNFLVEIVTKLVISNTFGRCLVRRCRPSFQTWAGCTVAPRTKRKGFENTTQHIFVHSSWHIFITTKFHYKYVLFNFHCG